LFSIEIDHAFQNKPQKTPKKEIKLAERRKQEFIKRE
jgi:phage-related protein